MNPVLKGGGSLGHNVLKNDLERVVSIESWDSPQCSTNVIGAFQGYIEKGMKKKFILYFPLF